MRLFIRGSYADASDRAVFPVAVNKKWGSHTVELILKNPLYYGFLRWEKYLKKGDYPPLIDQNTFTAVQATIKKRKTIVRHHLKKYNAHTAH